LGSSEVLESLLGKFKRIQGTHSKGGMSGSLLNLGAAVMRKTSETIKQALAAVPVAAVGQWVRDTHASRLNLRFQMVLSILEGYGGREHLPVPE
jgi:hypothetical protein